MDVAQLPGFEVVEMMMGRSRGIVDRALWIQVNLPHEPVLRQNLQSVVDRRLRDVLAGLANGSVGFARP